MYAFDEPHLLIVGLLPSVACFTGHGGNGDALAGEQWRFINAAGWCGHPCCGTGRVTRMKRLSANVLRHLPGTPGRRTSLRRAGHGPGRWCRPQWSILGHRA